MVPPDIVFPVGFIAATNGALLLGFMYATMGVLVPVESLQWNMKPESLYGYE